jgi:hypothetical protein
VVEAPRTETVVIPAEYGTIERRTQITAEKAEWRQVLCEANANVTVISAIQRALQTQGYYSGAIDGRLGQATYASVEAFQKSKNMSTGGLTLRTVDMLGVDWRSMVGGISGTERGAFQGGQGFDGGRSNGSTTGFSTGSSSSSSSTTTTTTRTGYTIGADRTVRDTSGRIIGRLDGNGNVVDASGTILIRDFMARSGTLSSSSLSSGSTTGSTTGSITTTRSVNGNVTESSTTGFTVRADGSVINASGAVIGRVDENGNIVDGNGRIIGRVNPR